MIFVVVVVVSLLGGGGFVAWSATHADDEKSVSQGGSLPKSNFVLFRDATPGANFERLEWSNLDDLQNKHLTGMQCRRSYFTNANGICVTQNSTRTGFVAQLFGSDLK